MVTAEQLPDAPQPNTVPDGGKLLDIDNNATYKNVWEAVVAASGCDETKVSHKIRLLTDVSPAGVESRTMTVPSIEDYMVHLGGADFKQRADTIINDQQAVEDLNENGAIYNFQANDNTCSIRITNRGLCMSNDLAQNIGLEFSDDYDKVLRKEMAKLILPGKPRDAKCGLATATVVTDSKKFVKFLVPVITVSNVNDINEEALSGDTGFAPSENAQLSATYTVIKPSLSDGSCNSVVAVIDTSSKAKARLRDTTKTMFSNIKEEETKETFLVHVAGGMLEIIRYLDAMVKLCSVVPIKSTDPSIKYEIQLIDHTTMLAHIANPAAALIAMPNLACGLAYIWLRDMSRVVSSGASTNPSYFSEMLLETARLTELPKAIKSKLGLEVRFTTSNSLYDFANETRQVANATTTINDATTSTKFLVRLIASYHRMNSSNILNKASTLTGKTQLLRFLRQICSASHLKSLQTDKAGALKMIEDNLDQNERSEGVSTNAGQRLIYAACIIHVAGERTRSLIRLLGQYRGDVTIRDTQQAYIQASISTRPYILGNSSTSNSTVLDWALNIMGTPLHDPVSPAFYGWKQDRKDTKYLSEMTAKALERAARLTRATRATLMFALSTEQVTIPKLVDRDNVGSSFAKSSVSEVLSKMKDLQLHSIGTVASHGNIRVVDPDGFEVGYEEATGTCTAKKIGAVFRMPFTATKLDEFISQAEKKLDGDNNHGFDTYATLQYINRPIQIYLFTDEEKEGRRIARKVTAAMPVTPSDIALGNNATNKDLERLLSHMVVFKQVVMKLDNLSIEETLILIAVLDNLFCHSPTQNVLKSHSASYGEYLIRLMYNVELVKINRLAVIRVTELGGESHKKAVEEARRLQEAVARRLKEETDKTSNAPVDDDVRRQDPAGLANVVYKLQAQVGSLLEMLPKMGGQQSRTT